MNEVLRMVRTIFLSGVVLLLATGCANQAPLVSPAQAMTVGQTTIEQRQLAIERAFVTPRSGRTWSVNQRGEGFFVATIQVREHSAQVIVEYSTPMITVTYLSSVNLAYQQKSNGTQLIHRNFNTWMQNFLKDANHELSVVVLNDRNG